jgi:hypothetical protein
VAIVQISRIQNRKGKAENLPQLAGAELGWSIDTRQLYIGNGTLQEGAPVIGNTEILTEFSDIFELTKNYTYKGLAAGYTVQTGPAAGDPVTQNLQSWMDQFATVKDFGATGDGVTDDTDAINRALFQLYCREVNPQIRRSLFFPAGIYRVTETILIPPYATLYGEGSNNSVIQLDDSADDSTLNAFVARTADSLQQFGINIGANSAIPPQFITVKDMGFANQDPITNVFLVQNAANCRFQSVGFFGPLTTTELVDETYDSACVRFASTGSLVCSQIVFDDCDFGGTTFALTPSTGIGGTDQQVSGVTVTNSTFDLFYQAIVLGGEPLVNGGATGFRIIGNRFDNIYAEGILFEQVSLNATAQNMFYNVGNHFGPYTTPFASNIDIRGNNNLCIGDMFARPDAFANNRLPGTAWPRVTLNDTQSIATTNGQKLSLGNYTTESAVVFNMHNDIHAITPIFGIDTDLIRAFTVNYTMIRGTGVRVGTLRVVGDAGDSAGTLSFTDDYTENSDLGVTLYVSQLGDIIDVGFTTTDISANAEFTYSINYMG